MKRQSKYKFKENFFEIIDTEEKAYWLGFLYADGCVRNNKKNRIYAVRLRLAVKDLSHLKKFKKALCSNHPIKINTDRIKYKNKWNEFDICSIYVYSIKMVEDLIALGCIPKKSLILKFPNAKQVPEKFIHHFIRGYFDGDGHIGFNHKFKLMGTKKFLNKVKDIIKVGKIKPQCNVFFLCAYKKKSIISIRDFLYRDYSICLKRKEIIFNKIRDNIYNYGIKAGYNSKPILQCDMNGKFVFAWESSTQASNYYKVSNGLIAAVCGKKYGKKSAIGYRWIFVPKKDYMIFKKKNPLNKPFKKSSDKKRKKYFSIL